MDYKAHLEPEGHTASYPPYATWDPQEIAGLMIRDYENPLVSLNKALLGPAISWGGWHRGVPLGSHDFETKEFKQKPMEPEWKRTHL